MTFQEILHLPLYWTIPGNNPRAVRRLWHHLLLVSARWQMRDQMCNWMLKWPVSSCFNAASMCVGALECTHTWSYSHPWWHGQPSTNTHTSNTHKHTQMYSHTQTHKKFQSIPVSAINPYSQCWSGDENRLMWACPHSNPILGLLSIYFTGVVESTDTCWHLPQYLSHLKGTWLGWSSCSSSPPRGSTSRPASANQNVWCWN